MSNLNWTDEIVAKLTKHWKDGLSCSQIALKLHEEFGVELSRSAVIGKLNRMGMRSNAEVTKLKNKQANRRTMARLGRNPRTPIQAGKERVHPGPRPGVRFNPDAPLRKTANNACVPLPLPPEEKPSDYAKLYSVQELTEKMCRFPIGDPLKPDFGFCGKDRVPGKPYCAGHCRRAYAPPEVRQRSPKPVVVPTFADLEKV
jgi:GcrA cell cycle regulator